MEDLSEKQIINYEDGIARFSGYRQIFEKYLHKFPTDNNFEALTLAMNNKDYETAFKEVHTLKGVIGNLSFDRFYYVVDKMTEMLRNQKDIPGAVKYMGIVQEEYSVLLKELENI